MHWSSFLSLSVSSRECRKRAVSFFGAHRIWRGWVGAKCTLHWLKCNSPHDKKVLSSFTDKESKDERKTYLSQASHEKVFAGILMHSLLHGSSLQRNCSSSFKFLVVWVSGGSKCTHRNYKTWAFITCEKWLLTAFLIAISIVFARQ